MIFNIRPIQFYPATADGSRVGYTPFIYRMVRSSCPSSASPSGRLGGPAAATELSVYGDLRPGLEKNLKWDSGFTGTAAVGGAAAGGAVGAFALGLGALAAAPAIGVGALFAAGTLGWYRWLYRRALAKATEELESLLLAVESSIRARSVFGGAPVPPWMLPPGSPRSGHDSAPLNRRVQLVLRLDTDAWQLTTASGEIRPKQLSIVNCHSCSMTAYRRADLRRQPPRGLTHRRDSFLHRRARGHPVLARV